MKSIKIYGSGCHNCNETMKRFEDTAKALGLEVAIEKVTDLEQIMLAGIMSTPGVAIDGEVKHTGSVPTPDRVTELLQS
ncbi:hypothetical protein ABT56_12485 [Photobacterium aquae]|uniref:Thioredoxin-like fold domain-containing protein n=1 Tax=Photobacterium aquae TaxID=1195763 RepID=A0A0J1H062_9GAMM|nr:thioredoxin family protein [Photobacterium aquae]KLV05194.1 hypothetical protein ABT56_12485 [Photobacterium aquae]